MLGDLNVLVQNDLDFGQVLIGSGEHTVAADDPGSGLFRINGTARAEVLLTIAARPTELTHPGGGTIPIVGGLQVGYTGGSGNQNNFVPCDGPTDDFVGSTEVVELRCNQTGNPNQGGRGEAFVWFFGTIDVGEVDPGEYTAEITLEAEYN